MPANEYGIYIRKLRKERGENLDTMAKKMGVSISFLSALEVGTKTIPQDIAERVGKVYELSLEQIKEIQNAIDLSNGKIQIQLEQMDDTQKDISLAFARTINTASQKKLEELRKLLESDDEE